MADDLAYLASLSEHPNRPGDVTNFNPDFSSRLANALRQARAAGLPLGVASGFREPGQTGSAYDAGGNSSHTYGLASDISGLDGPNGKVTNAWAQIAEANGLHNPYGVGDKAEFNHWQLPPQPLEQTPALLAQLQAAKATGDFKNVWNAYGTGAGNAAQSYAFKLPDNAPMGMGNNNPLNIKYVAGAPYAGLVGPSKNTDQGDPQMVFSSPEAGWSAAYQLLNRKYGSGMTSPAAIIAGQGGWTPGNMQAAANVAKSAGIGVNDDIGFNDPGKAAKFMRALVTQEQGGAGSAYPDQMIANAISGKPLPTTPGTTINTPAAGLLAGGSSGALPGFGTKQASDNFLAGLKKAGITPSTGQASDQQPDMRPSPIMSGPGLRNASSPQSIGMQASQLEPELTHYSPQMYGGSLNSQPLSWPSSPIPAPAQFQGAGPQQPPQGIGTSLNSMQMAYGLSPQQLQMMMNPMMFASEGGGYG